MTSFDPELLLAQSAWLRRLARQLAGDPHLAEDIVQDTWAQALVQPPQHAAAPGRLRAWIASVVRNSVRMHRRSARRRAAREAIAAMARETAEPGGAERLASQQRLLAAVQALPDADRDVLLLRFFDELPPRAIAQRLGTTSAAVRSRLSRALAALRARLTPAGDPRALATALLPLLGHGGPATARTLLFATLITNMAAKLTVFLGVLGLGLAAWLAWPAPALPTPSTGAVADATELAAATAGPTATTDAQRALAPAARERVARTPTAAVSAAPQGAAATGHFTIVGRCVDEQGRSLPGARLAATNVREFPTATADPDGRVALELVWPPTVTVGNPSWLELEATADRRIVLVRQERLPHSAPESIALGDLVLGPGGALAGLVLDADGTPARGAHVWLVRGTEPAGADDDEQRRVAGIGFQGLATGGMRTASADERGRYRFEGVPATSITVVAARGGRLGDYTPPVTVLTGGEVEAPPLTLAMLPAANTITGSVRGADGKPVAQAEVTVFGNLQARNADPAAQARTTAAGTFEVAVISGRQYSIAVQLDREHHRQLVRDDIAAGSRGVEFVFAAARAFEVLVTGPDGEVLKSPVMFALDEQSRGIALRWQDAADGAQRTNAPEQPFSLMVSAPGYQSKRAGPFDPANLPPRITVALARAATIDGRVLANGQALAGARVHAHWFDPARETLRFAGGLTTRLGGETTPAVTTDHEGHFTLPIPRAGRYVVHAESKDLGRGESPELEVAADRAPPPIAIELVPAAAIDGVVAVAPGDSREGVVVAATRGDGHVEVSVTDRDGSFRFAGLAAGAWQVRVCRTEDQEWLRQARTWPARPTDASLADVVLSPGQTARHRIDLAALFPAAIDGQLRLGGTAAANARISLWCDGEFRLTRTDGDGRFQLRGQAVATTLHVFVTMPGGGELEFVHALQLAAGTNPLSFDAPVGAVEFTDLAATPPTQDDPRGGYALVWERTASAPKCIYRFGPGTDGKHRAETLPAGRAQLHRRDATQRDPERWPAVATVEVVARERRIVSGK